MDGDVDTSRTAVKTYVPAYQKQEWQEHADRLEMSQSEFVRTMVQAGRRGFDPDDEAEVSATGDVSDHQQNEPTNGASEAHDLESRVVSILSDASYATWDELVAALTDDIEDRLEAALQSLQSENAVQYSGRNGGYTLSDP